jgi:hypothetical protein
MRYARARGASPKKRQSEKRNLTLKINSEVLQLARTLAAREGTSLSELFERLAQERSGRAASRAAARKELIAIAEKGLALGGAPYLTRDQSHER